MSVAPSPDQSPPAFTAVNVNGRDRDRDPDDDHHRDHHDLADLDHDDAAANGAHKRKRSLDDDAQLPYSSVERPDDPSKPWDYPKHHPIDPSDAQLAEALQREVQSETPSENASSALDLHAAAASSSARPDSSLPSQSPNSSSQVAPKRKRVFSNRTKTGCMTCRRRKKKCDEQHPSCNNCIRGGFPCEGYSVRSTWQKPSQTKGPIPLQSKDRYPEPPLYLQQPDMSPQRHDPRIAAPLLDGGKARPDDQPDRAYMTSPGASAARVAWQQKGAYHHIMQQQQQQQQPPPPPAEAKLEYRDGPVMDPKPDYHHSHPANTPSNNNNNAATNNNTANNNSNNTTPNNAAKLPVFQSNLANHAPPRVDSTNYPAQARLALSSMDPHLPFDQPQPASAIKSEKEKMLSGEQYRPFDPELIHDRERCKSALWRFNNATNPAAGISSAEKTRLLTRILQPEPLPSAPPPSTSTPTGSLGPGAHLEAPFNCHYGFNVNIGEDVLISENCFFADDCSINIGAHTWIGPNVTILSSMAIGSMQERKGSQSRYQGRPVVIAEDCWIGAGCTILPGVTLGRGAYIAPGEVVRSQILPYGFQGLKPNYP